MHLTERFEDALTFALHVHDGQCRKGTGIPYVSHLLAVAGIVLDYGGNEDEAVAALLHDTIEDGGVGEAEICARFGPEAANIVVACSDSLEKDPMKKRPWLERKKAYLEHMKTALAPALLVSAADKLHNARSIVKDLRESGAVLWSRFNAGREDSLWYYDSLVGIFKERGSHTALVDELSRTVDELRRLAGEVR